MTSAAESSLTHSNNIISVNGLVKKFGTCEALSGVSFTVAPEEIFGVLGPDGAGKTTLIRILAGLMSYNEGCVNVGGFDLKAEQPALSDIIAYMPQRFGLYEDLTVMENILFYADLYNMAEGPELDLRIEELLSFCRMSPFKNRRAGRLSGGMKQKLALSCALIHTPKILLLDEPTNGVDPVSRREFWKILTDMLKTGLTIFVSTTYLDEAERCHKIAFLNNGKISALDTPAGLKKSSKNLLWRIEVNDKFKAVEILKRTEKIVSALMMGPAIHVFTSAEFCENSLKNLIKPLLSQQNIELYSLKKSEPSLEDIFIEKLN